MVLTREGADVVPQKEDTRLTETQIYSTRVQTIAAEGEGETTGSGKNGGGVRCSNSTITIIANVTQKTLFPCPPFPLTGKFAACAEPVALCLF